jgi:hypothetical protein
MKSYVNLNVKNAMLMAVPRHGLYYLQTCQDRKGEKERLRVLGVEWSTSEFTYTIFAIDVTAKGEDKAMRDDWKAFRLAV